MLQLLQILLPQYTVLADTNNSHINVPNARIQRTKKGELNQLSTTISIT